MSVFVVSIDGPDFSGKTTIANLVVELLRQMNKGKKIQFRRTIVPSGFITGSFTSILRSSVDKVPPQVFALAYAADHLFHFNHSIKPLEKHKDAFVIIQERSLLTTYIYQGLLGKVDFEWIKEIKDPIVFGVINGCPDKFFISQWDDDIKIDDIFLLDVAKHVKE